MSSADFSLRAVNPRRSGRGYKAQGSPLKGYCVLDFKLMSFGNRRKHSKPGQTVVRAFHFRIETTPDQSAQLHAALDLGWELRNQLAKTLEDDRKAQRQVLQAGGEPAYVSALDLKKTVASAALDPKFKALHSQVRQELSRRISEGMALFFKGLREGRNVRPPHFLQRKHFRSLTYPQYGNGAVFRGNRLYLSKLGDFKGLGWRRMRGKKKALTVKFKDGHWWALVLCETQVRDVVRPYATLSGALPEAGIDPGVATVLTDSYGVGYATPKPLKAARDALKRRQREVSRKFEHRKTDFGELSRQLRDAGLEVPRIKEAPLSNRLRGAIRRLAKAHTKVERVRDDAAKKNARKVEQRYARVAVEEHSLQFIMRNRRLARAGADVAIGKQKWALRSALGAGRYFEAANRRTGIGGNSQTCLCGEPVHKTLKERWHKCPACGLEGPRDQVSAVICQYEQFGSVPNAATAGLAGLERALQALKRGRGASNGGSGESPAVGSGANRAVELAVKRQVPLTRTGRKTAGAQAKAAGKTGRHAGPFPPLTP